MNFYISLLNSAAVSFFGSILSASFCNRLSEPKKCKIFLYCTILIPIIQFITCSVWIWEEDFLRNIYPLIMHLPLLLVLHFLTGKIRWPVISIMCAYLCCQLRRWLALFSVSLFDGGRTAQNIAELLLTLPLLCFLLKFVSPAVTKFINSPAKLHYQFGIIPALYYIFDYVTVVYTDLLLSGSAVAVEFMPFVCCAAYITFILYYSYAEEKQIRLQEVQKSLDIQLAQSVREITALRESQELARQYRHDLRHHLQYISSCITNQQAQQAQNYISNICKEIEAHKVQSFCENEAANLIISSFASRAEKLGIKMEVQGNIPASISISDMDLCVILSNALENALCSCQRLIKFKNNCSINIQFYLKNNKLFLQIKNPCNNDIRFENGLPLSDCGEGHGIGTQSICAIVRRYSGVCTFSVSDEQFILRLSV